MCAGATDAALREGQSGDMAAVVVPVLFLLLLGVCGSLVALYIRHRRLQNNFTAFANSHYNSRLGSAIFSSGDELGKTYLFFFFFYFSFNINCEETEQELRLSGTQDWPMRSHDSLPHKYSYEILTPRARTEKSVL